MQITTSNKVELVLFFNYPRLIIEELAGVGGENAARSVSGNQGNSDFADSHDGSTIDALMLVDQLTSNISVFNFRRFHKKRYLVLGNLVNYQWTCFFFLRIQFHFPSLIYETHC